ncbi:dTDP-glucose 4,6-dehydratase [Endomicrobium proavitum]|uniref:dTDP-glucose 4,6-dehydratase n=1 Tax=Endomicrobium proavitum TaxID=1408281 RepID=A0A0G3WIU4_9BACT|nr:dTDP-glucose 4,6-dehydratase [Endomicrobium proavitum]AKL97810.1 dTDP-glucose 4,6-dehydratase [Endomicrobium proavitum]
MKLFVTGGAGFIGSNFIRHILSKYPNYKIINYDKLTYAGNLKNLKDIAKNKNYKFVKGDICNYKFVNKYIKDVDAIINFAAETHVDRSIANADAFVKTNVNGTFTLLEAAKANKIKKYLQVSTDEVYGSILKGSFTEESYICPNSPYSASKASADMLCRAYFVTYGFPAMITRCSNNYGPYQYPEKVIPLFISNALKNKNLPLYGDGKNVRDWLYVEDHCRAIDIVLHKGKAGEVYNIGGGQELSNIELTKKILKILEKPETLIKRVADRLGHDRRYSINYNKIKKLGYKPQFTFEKAIKETVKWYKENK